MDPVFETEFCGGPPPAGGSSTTGSGGIIGESVSG